MAVGVQLAIKKEGRVLAGERIIVIQYSWEVVPLETTNGQTKFG